MVSLCVQKIGSQRFCRSKNRIPLRLGSLYAFRKSDPIAFDEVLSFQKIGSPSMHSENRIPLRLTRFCSSRKSDPPLRNRIPRVVRFYTVPVQKIGSHKGDISSPDEIEERKSDPWYEKSDPTSNYVNLQKSDLLKNESSRSSCWSRHPKTVRWLPKNRIPQQKIGSLKCKLEMVCCCR